VRKLKLLDELVDAFLNGNDNDMSYVLNRRTGEILMVNFAKKQSDPIKLHLINVLNRNKLFRFFKEMINELGIENHWYQYEQDYAMCRMTEWLEEFSEIEDSNKVI